MARSLWVRRLQSCREVLRDRLLLWQVARRRLLLQRPMLLPRHHEFTTSGRRLALAENHGHRFGSTGNVAILVQCYRGRPSSATFTCARSSNPKLS